jgi:ABC-type glycerol-3-phosphate transport system substrate-binding protein
VINYTAIGKSMVARMKRQGKTPLGIWIGLLLGCGLFLAGCTQSPAPAPQTTRLSTHSAAPNPGRRTPTPSPIAPSPQPASAIQVDLQDLRGLQVTLWHPWSGSAASALSELIEEFNAQNEWGIQVNSLYKGNFDDLFNQVITTTRPAGAPDLTLAYPYQAQAYDASVRLVDLNLYLQDPHWGLSSTQLAGFYPVFLESSPSGTKRLGFPALRSAQVLFYNQGWARQLGFDRPPATPDEFRRQACAAQQANLRDSQSDNDHTGGWIISTDYPGLLGWMYAYGAQVYRPGDGYQFDTPQVAQAFRFLRGLYDDGCAWLPEAQSPESDFAARRGLFATGSLDTTPAMAGAMDLAHNSDSWSTLPFPSPQGQPAIDVYGPDYVVLARQPAKALAAWLFIGWMSAAPNQARFAQASNSLPLSQDALREAQDLAGSYPAWLAALNLIPDAGAEPPLPSWSTVRWAVGDAGTQLFRYYFTIDQVPSLVKLLDQTAAELNARSAGGTNH